MTRLPCGCSPQEHAEHARLTAEIEEQQATLRRLEHELQRERELETQIHTIMRNASISAAERLRRVRKLVKKHDEAQA